MSFCSKKYNLQKGELYMKPALLGIFGIFGMPKDRDCILYNKKLFPLTVKNLSMLAYSTSLEFLTIFIDKLYT